MIAGREHEAVSGNETTVTTESPEETQAFGARLARDLTPGTIIALIGDLGSGKTCLTQGICAGLDVQDYVTSPTFTLINEYQGRLPVYHFDMYRIEKLEEIHELGCDEYFFGDGICIIEWAEKIRSALPVERMEINLERLGDTKRKLTITVFEER